MGGGYFETVDMASPGAGRHGGAMQKFLDRWNLLSADDPQNKQRDSRGSAAPHLRCPTTTMSNILAQREINSRTCPVCAFIAKNQGGLRSHLRQKPACQAEIDHWNAPAAIETHKHPRNPTPSMNNSPDSSDNESNVEPYTIPDFPIPASEPPSPTAPEPKRRRTTVEDAPEEDNPEHLQSWIEDFPFDAGSVIEERGAQETMFEELKRKLREAGQEMWSPFKDNEEWDVARWLMTSGLSQKEIEKFLKLTSVRPLDAFTVSLC